MAYQEEIGARYVLDTRKRIIHDLQKAGPECRIEKIKPIARKKLFNREQVMFEVNTNNSNGCRHCMPELDYSDHHRRR